MNRPTFSVAQPFGFGNFQNSSIKIPSHQEFLGKASPILSNEGEALGPMGKYDEVLEYLTRSLKALYTALSEGYSYNEMLLKNLIQYLKNQTDTQLVKKTKAKILIQAVEKLGEIHPLVRALENKDE